MAIALIVIATPVRADETLPEKVSYNFHVKSILSENCFACHGPDANQRQADFRLDVEGGADAELVDRIFSDDPDLQMPPADSNLSLTAREKEILKRWVEQGAEYETHWAYQGIEKPTVPKVRDQEWARNPIDHFILAKLESNGIEPSPRAQPQVLVRRMYLDLIGLTTQSLNWPLPVWQTFRRRAGPTVQGPDLQSICSGRAHDLEQQFDFSVPPSNNRISKSTHCRRQRAARSRQE